MIRFVAVAAPMLHSISRLFTGGPTSAKCKGWSQNPPAFPCGLCLGRQSARCLRQPGLSRQIRFLIRDQAGGSFTVKVTSSAPIQQMHGMGNRFAVSNHQNEPSHTPAFQCSHASCFVIVFINTNSSLSGARSVEANDLVQIMIMLLLYTQKSIRKMKKLFFYTKNRFLTFFDPMLQTFVYCINKALKQNKKCYNKPNPGQSRKEFTNACKKITGPQ